MSDDAEKDPPNAPSGPGGPSSPDEPKGGERVRMQHVLEDGIADGIYSNVASISFSPSEFFVDFGRVVPGRRAVKVHSRIILSPGHARRLAQVLLDHVKRYESAHGSIPTPSDPGRDLGVH